MIDDLAPQASSASLLYFYSYLIVPLAVLFFIATVVLVRRAAHASSASRAGFYMIPAAAAAGASGWLLFSMFGRYHDIDGLQLPPWLVILLVVVAWTLLLSKGYRLGAHILFRVLLAVPMVGFLLLLGDNHRLANVYETEGQDLGQHQEYCTFSEEGNQLGGFYITDLSRPECADFRSSSLRHTCFASEAVVARDVSLCPSGDFRKRPLNADCRRNVERYQQGQATCPSAKTESLPLKNEVIRAVK